MSIAATLLLFTPTYGIGVVLAPLTIIGSYVGTSPAARDSLAVRLGAGLNVLIVLIGLTLLTVIWWSTAWPVLLVAWGIALSILLTLAARGRNRETERPA